MSLSEREMRELRSIEVRQTQEDPEFVMRLRYGVSAVTDRVLMRTLMLIAAAVFAFLLGVIVRSDISVLVGFMLMCVAIFRFFFFHAPEDVRILWPKRKKEWQSSNDGPY